MEEQLSAARRQGWCHAGVTPIGGGRFGHFESVNERRNIEFLRVANDLASFTVKPPQVDWIDGEGVRRKYQPDALAVMLSSEKVAIEIKPRGVLTRGNSLRAKYEAIGRDLQTRGQMRFGLLEWQWDGHLERNIALLARYWFVEPGSHALDAFADIGQDEVALDALFARVDRDHWPAVWAALAQQHLAADLSAGRVNRQTKVSLPGVIYDPVTLASLITTWWA